MTTRQGREQSFCGFYLLLQVRSASAIELAFGVRLVSPVEECNTSRHVGDESPRLAPPPTPEPGFRSS